MENNSRMESETQVEVDKIYKEIQPALYEYNFTSIETFREIEKDLNAKIQKTKMILNDKYPDLSKYIEEIQEIIPHEKTPIITLKNLKGYYDYLNLILNTYIFEHSDNLNLRIK